jgi:hypothetical protein
MYTSLEKHKTQTRRHTAICAHKTNAASTAVNQQRITREDTDYLAFVQHCILGSDIRIG